MRWEVTIGLETHVQLSTVSKIFSGVATQFGAEPNTQACPIDLGLPGVLPVLNRVAVEYAIRFGLAVGANIAPYSIFARKNYFYPDLPKGYQISQFEIPVVQGGQITIHTPSNNMSSNGTCTKIINLTRAHLEEDAGKLLHEGLEGMTCIDLNRSGIPLLEVVTKPEIGSASEAVVYAKTLYELVVWLEICNGNMQEGSFRCDANVSVRPAGNKKFGTRTEIKNLNSFSFLEDAINHEVNRQIKLIHNGGEVIQETRLYDSDRCETRAIRRKENVCDYRYFPDPDLMPIIISPDWVESVKRKIPRLRPAIQKHLISKYKISSYNADILTSSRAMTIYFEAVVDKIGVTNAKIAANWLIGDVLSYMNRNRININLFPVSVDQLGILLQRIIDGTISKKIAKEIFIIICNDKVKDKDIVDQIIDKNGFRQINDTGMLEAIVDDVLAKNMKLVNQFHEGKEKAFNALVGQVIKSMNGNVNPAHVNKLLKNKLQSI